MAQPKTTMGGDEAAFPVTRWSQVQHAAAEEELSLIFRCLTGSAGR